jgi:hypothetical protein
MNRGNFGRENQPVFIGLVGICEDGVVFLSGSVWNARGENKIREYSKT